MALAINIQTTFSEKEIQSKRSWNENPMGVALIYGPFMREGQLTSEGDQNFHKSLIQTDPDLGYKNNLDMMTLFAQSGLSHLETVEMPANNLAFVLQKK